MIWDDDSRAQVISKYQDSNPTAETSVEIVNDIAEEIGASPNGVRKVLSQAGVYIKKAPAEKKASSSGGGTRVNKAEAQQALTNAIEALGKTADEDIISKLTGKAAIYFVGILTAEESE